jgi:hypothetical protein
MGPASGGTVESRSRVCCAAADVGASVVFMPVKYRASRGRAMGASRSGSKPKGLDVGVLCHGFVWVRLKKCSKSRLMPLVGFFGRWFVEGWSMVGRRWDDGFRSEWCTFLRFDLMRERFGTWLGSESFLALGVTRLVGGGAC